LSASKPKRWNIWVAFVATYMLVFQGLLGAVALGDAKASPMLDAFGNPLCITSTDSDSDDRTHTGLPDCCTVSCSMFAVASAGDRSSNSFSNPLPTATAALFPPVEVGTSPFTLDREQGSPRAPPPSL